MSEIELQIFGYQIGRTADAHAFSISLPDGASPTMVAAFQLAYEELAHNADENFILSTEHPGSVMLAERSKDNLEIHINNHPDVKVASALTARIIRNILIYEAGLIKQGLMETTSLGLELIEIVASLPKEPGSELLDNLEIPRYAQSSVQIQSADLETYISTLQQRKAEILSFHALLVAHGVTELSPVLLNTALLQ